MASLPVPGCLLGIGVPRAEQEVPPRPFSALVVALLACSRMPQYLGGRGRLGATLLHGVRVTQTRLWMIPSPGLACWGESEPDLCFPGTLGLPQPHRAPR